MTTQINEPCELIKSYHADWKRNRHVIAGARLIRKHSRNYLPLIFGQTLPEYQAYIQRVPFFPAASRTREGLLGLIFAKAPTINAPASALPLLNTLTASGDSIETLAKEVIKEILTTNFVGLLVDYPITPPGMSQADAITSGSRPFVAMFKAESILGIETAVVANQQVVSRVRLLDDVNTVRELRLDNGIYTITMHYLINNAWVAAKPITPTKAGKALNRIPFTLGSTNPGYEPTEAPLSDLCDHNIQLYLASANLATCHYYSSAPIYNVFGTGEDASVDQFPVYPGAIWLFSKPEKEAGTKVLEYTGTSIEHLRKAVEDLKEDMAAIGSRILAGEKKGVETADAMAIRRAAENATLAAISRLGDRVMNDTLDNCANWLNIDPGSITYEANTNFNALPIDPQGITARVAAWQAGAWSHDALIDQFIDGEVLPETFDKEADRAKIAQDVQDRPPTGL